MLDMAKKKTRRDQGGQPRKPMRTGKPISIWVPSELRAALDGYIDKQRVPPDLTAVVRIALEEFLRREGLWPPPPGGAEKGGGD